MTPPKNPAHPCHAECPCPARREFLTQAASAALLVSAGTLIQACGKKGSTTATGTEISPVSGNTFLLKFTDFSGLSSAGGSVAAILKATIGNQGVYVTRVDSSTAKT